MVVFNIKTFEIEKKSKMSNNPMIIHEIRAECSTYELIEYVTYENVNIAEYPVIDEYKQFEDIYVYFKDNLIYFGLHEFPNKEISEEQRIYNHYYIIKHIKRKLKKQKKFGYDTGELEITQSKISAFIHQDFFETVQNKIKVNFDINIPKKILSICQPYIDLHNSPFKFKEIVLCDHLDDWGDVR